VIRLGATILIAVQALLPPGMCLCEFVPSGASTRQAHAPAPAPPTSAAAHVDESCCSCAACRAAVPAAPPSSYEQAATDCGDPHERHPLPTPASPCSGCPVVSAGPAARVAILLAPEQAPLDAAVHFVVARVEAAAPRAARPNPVVATAAPPLFVRHCALLI
jgi:hypothetical protein